MTSQATPGRGAYRSVFRAGLFAGQVVKIANVRLRIRAMLVFVGVHPMAGRPALLAHVLMARAFRQAIDRRLFLGLFAVRLEAHTADRALQFADRRLVRREAHVLRRQLARDAHRLLCVQRHAHLAEVDALDEQIRREDERRAVTAPQSIG